MVERPPLLFMDGQRLIAFNRHVNLLGIVGRALPINHAYQQRLQVPAAKQWMRSIRINLHTKTSIQRCFEEINGSQRWVC